MTVRDTGMTVSGNDGDGRGDNGSFAKGIQSQMRPSIHDRTAVYVQRLTGDLCRVFR